MKEPEELQAQIDVLRQLVISLVAQNTTSELISDVKMRLEVWEDMHIPSPVSESYLDLVREEKHRILGTLESLHAQSHGDTERPAQTP